MIVIDYRDNRPLYEQIVERFVMLIERGVLKPESQMPSVRSLAMELSINPNTIQKAYTELERRGFIYTIKGRGNFVSYDDTLRKKRQVQQLEECRQLILNAKEVGILKQELLAIVDTIYEKEGEMSD